MKKKLVSIISLLIALIMCFSLVACGNDDNDGNDNVPAMSAADISAAIEKLVSSDGFSGDMTIDYTSNKSDGYALNGDLEKRKQQVMFTEYNDDNTVAKSTILDMDTGYMYAHNELDDSTAYTVFAADTSDDSFYARSFRQIIPADTYVYVLTMLDRSLGGQNLSGAGAMFAYDKNTEQATVVFDAAAGINNLLAPLLTSYKGNGNVKDLLNNYLKMFSPDPANPVTVANILDILGAFIEENSDMTAGEMFEYAELAGIDVYGMLETYLGMEFDEETKAAMEARTLGEMVVGLRGAIVDVLPLADDEEESDGTAATLVQNIFYGVFFEEVDIDGLDEAIEDLKYAVDLGLYMLKTRKVVDQAWGGDSATQEQHELYEIIVNNVKFEKLNVKVTLSFDDGKNISKVEAVYSVKHSYSGTTSDSKLLSDNNYVCTVVLNVDEYLTDPDAFEIEFAEYQSLQSTVSAVVGVADGDVVSVLNNGISVYYETAGKDVEITTLSPYMTFDAQTSRFIFDVEELQQYYASELADGTLNEIIGYAEINGGEQTVAVTVALLPYEPRSLFELLYEYLLDFMDNIGDIDSGVQSPDVYA